MHEYLIDRETLGQFVDALIKQKYPEQPAGEQAEAFEKYREQLIEVLDNRIAANVFGGLSYDAHNELDQLLDDPNTSPETFRAFFEKYNLSPEDIIKTTLEDYKTEFLGGQNA